MFIAFIAVALELAAIAFGAKVVLACYKACFRRNYLCGDRLGENAALERTESATSYVQRDHPHHEGTGQHKREAHCFGFLKFIGYFVMALSFIALVCTIWTMTCFMKDVKDLQRHHNGSAPTEQYRYDLDKLRLYSGNHG